MPIRRLTLNACAYGVMLACSTHVQADASSWDGSYAAKGACYCSGEQSRYIDSKIVPTPVGGQSVAQICERVGEGPTLQKINGKFNYTVYPDAQCGNGPFSASTTIDDKHCIGHLGVSGEDCAIRGPRWDLADAYSRKIETDDEEARKSIVTGGSRHIEPPAKKVVKADGENREASETPVAEIASARSQSKKLARKTPKIAKPETREQIRARQLVHLAAARKRAKLAQAAQSNSASESPEGSLPDAAAAVVKPETLKPAQSEVSKKASVESVVETVESPSVSKETPTIVSALKLPAGLGHSNPDINYIEATPVTYDFGGAGLGVAASKSSHNRMQYVLNAAVADTYQEAAIGIGMFFTPPQADRATLMVRAGLEYGSFNFKNSAVTANRSDTGAFAALASNFVISRQFELQAGVSYSSFFEGDVTGFGAAFYHLTPKLDLTAKTEIGDNDLFGFGIRYHY